jgi:hypothetical protein
VPLLTLEHAFDGLIKSQTAPRPADSVGLRWGPGLRCSTSHGDADMLGLRTTPAPQSQVQPY